MGILMKDAIKREIKKVLDKFSGLMEKSTKVNFEMGSQMAQVLSNSSMANLIQESGQIIDLME
jgi:hypothetical protein